MIYLHEHHRDRSSYRKHSVRLTRWQRREESPGCRRFGSFMARLEECASKPFPFWVSCGFTFIMNPEHVLSYFGTGTVKLESKS